MGPLHIFRSDHHLELVMDDEQSADENFDENFVLERIELLC